MAQSSGPISQGTVAERQMTDDLWRNIFGDEPGVFGDIDGTAYNLTLPTDSDTALVGSSTQTSTARVAGFGHSIPAGSPEPITIPAASGSARNDIIALRYDPAYTGLPGPVRLVRIAGTSTSLPTYDATPPGVEDLPLWSVTRQPGQALSQATVQRLYSRITPNIDLPVGAALPLSSPIGTTVRQGTAKYRRDLSSAGVPVWVPAETRGTLTFRRLNYPVPHNSPLRIVSPWTIGQSNAGHFTVQADGIIKMQTDGIVSVYVHAFSDSSFRGSSTAILDVPGQTEVNDTPGVEDRRQREQGYAGAGLITQPLNWTGPVRAGQHIAVLISQFSESGGELRYNFHGSINYIG